jgi:hypothetical protein
MRTLQLLCAILLLSALTFAQNPGRSNPGYAGCFYGCAPFVPLVSTPMISFQTVSASPVGATNATGGLSAGATDSTMESLPVDSSTDHTQVVWYWGANTVPTREVAETALTPLHHPMMEPMQHMEHTRMMHHGEEQAVYIAGPLEPENVVQSAEGARSVRKATRTITNQDIDQLNQKTGTVKYDSKTEKIQ